MIAVRHLSKHYRVHEREPGLVNSLRSFVRRRYRAVKAVDAISFDIAPGEIVGFLGPNGAGKTTTLKMLSGWEMAFASLAIATVLLLASHLFWRFALANYTSASS